MTLGEHLEELRNRLFYSLFVVFLLAILAYVSKDQLMAIVIYPFQNALRSTLGLTLSSDQIQMLAAKMREWLSAQICGDRPCFTQAEVEATVSSWQRSFSAGSGLIFTHPTEAFFGYVKLSFYVGLLAGMPFVLYQVWRFVVPALYQKERKYMLNALLFGSALFYGGAIFCFVVVIPVALYFLIGVGQPYLVPLFTLNNYISFVMLLMLLFGLSFELPLAMYLLVRVGLVEHRLFVQQWRWVIVGAFVVGAVLTPTPDPFTQVALAGPLIVLYGVGLLLTRFAQPQAAQEVAIEKTS